MERRYNVELRLQEDPFCERIQKGSLPLVDEVSLQVDLGPDQLQVGLMDTPDQLSLEVSLIQADSTVRFLGFHSLDG